jgi:hypothetical protein
VVDADAIIDTSEPAESGTTADDAAPGPADTDWMHGRYGVGIHYLKDWSSSTAISGWIS